MVKLRERLKAFLTFLHQETGRAGAAEFAERTGLSKGYISKLTRGLADNPEDDFWAAVLKAFGETGVDFLMGNSDDLPTIYGRNRMGERELRDQAWEMTARSFLRDVPTDALKQRLLEEIGEGRVSVAHLLVDLIGERAAEEKSPKTPVSSSATRPGEEFLVSEGEAPESRAPKSKR